MLWSLDSKASRVDALQNMDEYKGIFSQLDQEALD
jgi:hypothetical protein